MKNKKQYREKTRFLLLGFAVIIVISGSIINNFYAKYKSQISRTDNVKTGTFYFTSDLLSEEGKEYTLASDTTLLEIKLRNYADELRISKTGIKYKYNIQNLTDAGTSTESSGEGQLSGGSKEAGIITLSDMTMGTKYLVTVETTEPFTTILKGTFTVQNESDDLTYKVIDSTGSPYVFVEVYTGKYKGKITMNWPAQIIPDSTDETLSEIQNFNGSTKEYEVGSISNILVEPYSSYQYRFLKQDTTNIYTENAFSITKENN